MGWKTARRVGSGDHHRCTLQTEKGGNADEPWITLHRCPAGGRGRFDQNSKGGTRQDITLSWSHSDDLQGPFLVTFLCESRYRLFSGWVDGK